MRYVGRGRGIRRRTYTGLIGIQASFYTVHYGSAKQPSGYGRKVERSFEYSAYDGRQRSYIKYHDYQGYSYISDSHDRYHDLSRLGNSLSAAEYDYAGKNGYYCAYDQRSIFGRDIRFDEVRKVE